MSDEAADRGVVYRASLRVGGLVLGAGRLAWAALPARVRDNLENRFFGAIFQVTRVTNDAYGWRPDDTRGGPAQPPEEAETKR